MENPKLRVCLQTCYEKVQKWNSVPIEHDYESFQNSLLKHTKIVDDIVQLLQNIITLYEQIQPTIGDVMKFHPTLGPFLTSLCKNSCVLLHHPCCNLLIKILLWFYKVDCSDKLQKWANKWVLDQLDHCFRLRKNITFSSASSLGKLDHHLMLKEDLKKIITSHLHPKNPVVLAVSIASLQYAEDLLDVIIQTLPNYPVQENDIVSSVLYILGNKIKQNELHLAFCGKLKMWKLYKPAVEWEIITMLQNVSNNLWIKSDLFEACLLEVDICRQAISVFSKILIDSSFHSSVLNCFKELLDNIKMHENISYFPIHLQHLVMLLQIQPINLTPSEKFIQAETVMKIINFDIYNNRCATYEIKALLICFPCWIIIILYSILSCEHQHKSLAMNFISYLHDNCICFERTIKLLKENKVESVNNTFEYLIKQNTCCGCLNIILILIHIYTDENDNEKLVTFVNVLQKTNELEVLSDWVKNHLIISGLFNNKNNIIK